MLTEAEAVLAEASRVAGFLKMQREGLAKERTRLQAITEYESRDNVWCADFRENLALGAVLPTIEVDGEPFTILLAPGGATTGLGILQPALASTPAGFFRNLALLPCWQKWKPTYRVAQVLAVTTSPDVVDICVYEAFSMAAGLPINQAGMAASVPGGAVSGFSAFAAANPTDALVTNTGEATVTLTPALMAELQSINAAVNNHHTYKYDIDQYGKLEQWSYMAEGGSGDCEDYALTKAKKLLDLGWPAGALKLDVGVVPTGEGYAWLTVATDKGELSLDLNYRDVMPTAAMLYKRTKQLTAGAWTRYGIRMDAVPVVYLN